MRKSMSTSEVAHAWANQTQPSAYSNSLSFEGPSIFSYGLEIARICKNKRASITLIVEVGVSTVTTSTHQGIVKDACSHHERLVVPAIAGAPKLDHAEMFGAWQYKAKRIAAHLERATKPVKYLDELAELSSRIGKYAAFFGVRVPAGLSNALAVRTAKEWIAVDKRDRAKADREKAAKVRRELKARAVALDEWRQFKRSSVSRFDRDFLRYDSEKHRIETSQGVRIPVAVGKRIFAWMMPLAAAGGCAPCDYKILDFDVRAVHTDRLEVGCHTVYFDEVQAIAAQLGWV